MAGLRRKNLLCSFLGILGLAGLVAAGAGCGDGHDHSAHDHGAPVVKTPEVAAAPADAPELHTERAEEVASVLFADRDERYPHRS